MSTEELESRLVTAEQAVSQSCAELMRRYRGAGAELDGRPAPHDADFHPDRASEVACRRVLSDARPDDAILGEDGGFHSGSSGFTWVLDPLDSTVNFMRGLPMWSVTLAGRDPDGTAAAVVAAPACGETFSATRESEVRLNGQHTVGPVRRPLGSGVIALSGEVPVGEDRSLEIYRTVGARAGKTRVVGSVALALAWTAVGRFDAAYHEMVLHDWDITAAVLLCRRAGLTILSREVDGRHRLLVTQEHLRPILEHLLD